MDSNQEQTRFPWANGDPTSKMIAMSTPEILSKIMSFLDQPTLQACLRVSSLWHACSYPITWQVQTISALDFMSLFSEQSDRDEHGCTGNDSSRDRVEAIRKNCHRIRSLTVNIPDGRKVGPFSLPNGSRFPSGLTNLVQFALQEPPGNPLNRTWSSDPTVALKLYDHIESTVSHNPRIRDLEWEMWGDMDKYDFIGKILKRTVKNLKKLSVFTGNVGLNTHIIEYLIQRSRSKDWSILNGVDIKGEAENYQEREGDSRCELDELSIKAYSLDVRWNALLNMSGALPIRKLNIWSISDSQRQTKLCDSLLAILSKCPNLESLCVSPKFIFTLDPLQSIGAYIDYKTPVPATAGDSFVELMYKSCPRLRGIEFGLVRLTTKHWIEMMTKYGRQLETFSNCGYLAQFNSHAFMTLIGPPLTHPTRLGKSRCLTRLNINGMEHLHNCAWKALQILPQLREFRAQGIHMDARQLVTRDGWACKDLQVLEIRIMVLRIPPVKTWRWCDHHDGWTEHETCCQMEEEALYDDGESNDTLQPNSDELDDTRLLRVLPYQKRIQVKVCENIGRLTRLRELRIEGHRGTSFDRYMWDCLELSLDTGLEHLAPLQQNLEKLNVAELDDNLGRREFEWMTRNWVHHSNRSWLEEHAPTCSPVTDYSEDDIIPCPKFKELLGVRKEGIDQDIEWMQMHCPKLNIVKKE
ncbi:hypothetical protein B0O80DRAFT_465338 [Mortierella sp. GBAus27b]|nr:hypothetical protein BGX31_007078 [Mortierella sp. GBA43]KAI8347534.1 hypothetical protein B0O80DRAFT_465338 [Mortierella sp. GBAus27b]